MSDERSGGPPQKSNTGLFILIVVLVLAALTIPALCLFGAASYWLFREQAVPQKLAPAPSPQAEPLPDGNGR